MKNRSTLALLLVSLCFFFLQTDLFAQTNGCPRVWRDGAVLKTDPQPNLQWYKDGVAIPGATGSEIPLDGTGVYRVGAAAERVPFIVEKRVAP